MYFDVFQRVLVAVVESLDWFPRTHAGEFMASYNSNSGGNQPLQATYTHMHII